MATTLPPQYRAAEAALRSARTGEERRAALESMLAGLAGQPEFARLSLDIKRRLVRQRQEAERRTAKRGQSLHVEPDGAAQVLLLGAPNTGKSSLLAALTRAEPAIADYPFTTTRPQAGLMLFEDVQIQVVDLPAITATHLDPWMPGLLQTADAALLLADPSQPGVLAGIEEVSDRAAAAHAPLVGTLTDAGAADALPLPTLLVVAMVDKAAADDMAVLEELYGERFPIVRYSAVSRSGLQPLKMALWRLLQLTRVYLKATGKRLERSEPFILPHGSTVADLAGRIDPTLPERLAYARVWGGKLDGQRVARDFELRDRDVVELAT